MTAEQLAQFFHETYERLAPQFGYKTREESAKPWAEVPEQNRKLMTAVCAEVLTHAAAQLAEKEREIARLTQSNVLIQEAFAERTQRLQEAQAEIKRLEDLFSSTNHDLCVSASRLRQREAELAQAKRLFFMPYLNSGDSEGVCARCHHYCKSADDMQHFDICDVAVLPSPPKEAK